MYARLWQVSRTCRIARRSGQLWNVTCSWRASRMVDKRDCGVRLNAKTATSEPRETESDGEPSQEYCTQLQDPTDFYRDSSSSIPKYEQPSSTTILDVSTYKQQVALESIPLDHWRLVRKTFSALSNGSRGMQPNSLIEQRLLDTLETMIPINIIEELTKSRLYWNNGLKSKAPDDCARNAQFKMITVSDYQDGLIVKFQSLVKTPIPSTLLSVNCGPKCTTPTFVLLPDGLEEYTINQFCWGPGDADFKYFRFLNPYTKQLCYWVVDGDNIVVRTQEEVSKKELTVHVFRTEVVEGCN